MNAVCFHLSFSAVLSFRLLPYLHGFFDAEACREVVLSALCEKKGVSLEMEAFDLKPYKEAQYDRLAEGVRGHLDMGLIYKILEAGI